MTERTTLATGRSPVLVKICGLSTAETLEAALDAGADMIGLNFFPKSPRSVSIETGAALAAQVRGRAEIVALTVDMDDAGLAAIVEAVRPDWLQLHGHEDPDRVAALQRQFGLGVLKAIGIRTADDLAEVTRHAGIADHLLIDAKPPAGAVLPGGNGVPFDWALLDGIEPGLPYMLSGGLNPGNVAEAIARTGARGIDVSSGVEAAPGIKDAALIRAFIAAVRGGSENEDGRSVPARG
ncbi:phosphoribosylanthranilate isomerase [Kaistia soli DSM 19436]|uniref:N-(5'-phosphoribosyl)anthranilate isomerase n=1 Tax=Kaistia soli DSM 19436 TaxID=1122133 RepID=A0A1M5D965_9HYPH|nr:phosphoribosylanthranilate isomerase [Kaistia soli]SHF63558.1 phosphoribosylanthranilate isomerase [Kaistia soli DSM 19436]